MEEKIFRKNDYSLPDDFGRYVNQKNIEKHLQYLKSQIDNL